MYRTNAYKEQTPEKKKLTMTKDQIVGLGLFLLLKGFIIAIIGGIIHDIMIPNGKIPHTNPIMATGCMGLGALELTIGGCILGFLMLRFLFRVAIGDEEL